MFEIKEPTKLTVKLFGHTAEFNAPSAVELQTVQAKSEEAGAGNVFNVWLEWFQKIGIPKAALDRLETKHIVDLIGYVTGVEKN